MKILLLLITLLFPLWCLPQSPSDSSCGATGINDSVRQAQLNQIVISASRISEKILQSPVSIEQVSGADLRKCGAPGFYDATAYLRGVQQITPSLGFKVINTRGFANTTNVRFAQLIDGMDNQAPHLGAPVANALGANDLDIDKVELIPGTASALYGMNALNGLLQIRTKNPFDYQGLSVQQLTGANHMGKTDPFSTRLYSQTNLRYARAWSNRFAFKMTGGLTQGTDWVADNRTDLAASLNTSTGLFGSENPAYDEVNGYGNESSNRRTLYLNGKNYQVSRTGYRESEIDDYSLENYKGDAQLFYRPSPGKEISLAYKGAIINTLYQRSNRFRLKDYKLNQYSICYDARTIQIKSYLTSENTGKSYNLRSLAENMDRACKSDNQWFSSYTTAFNSAIATGASVSQAHQNARTISDEGRYLSGTDAYNKKKEELININNWDYGAALRVKAYLWHNEAAVSWDKLFPETFRKLNMQLLSGTDYRRYTIIPDGNYFINPTGSAKNLIYSKTGLFLQITQSLLKNRLKLSATLRADKQDYFSWKFNPRITTVYSFNNNFTMRAAYQSGYRFPSIFEGFSNINSGGVKRIGGLKVMSTGIFENSYTKTSIEAFRNQVNNDVNKNGLSQNAAIEKNKSLLQKNPYTYLKPEFVRSSEIGIRSICLNKNVYIDADFYFNTYDNFIAQVEASTPNSDNPDSVAICLFNKSTQKRYRLWTNSTSRIYNYGAGFGIRCRLSEHFTLTNNLTYSKLRRIENADGLEDGFNTPALMVNATLLGEQLWNTLSASLSFRYQTSYNYVSFLVNGEVPSYSVFDGQVSYTFTEAGLVIKAGASNLLNKYYYSILGGPECGGLYYLSLTYSINP